MSLGAAPAVALRPFAARDAPALAGIYREAVRETGARDYTAAQVAAWLTRAPTPERILAKYCDGRTALVAVGDAGRPLGFGDLETDGHIDMLYVSPAAAGLGIARRLLAALEAEARRAEVGRLFSEASETARPVFARAGFRIVRRREVCIAGTVLQNWAVEKPLTTDRRGA